MTEMEVRQNGCSLRVLYGMTLLLSLIFTPCLGSCPLDWMQFKSKCYYTVSTGSTWQHGQETCENMESHLVTVDDASENEYLSSRKGDHNSWIGLNNRRTGGKMEWVDGSPVDYTNWNVDETDNTDVAAHCAMITSGSSGLWINVSCSDAAELCICETDADTDECEQDTITSSDAQLCRNVSGSECMAGYTESESGICTAIECKSVNVKCEILPSGLCKSAADGVSNVTFPRTLAGYSAISSTVCGEYTTNANTPLGSKVCALNGTWTTSTWLMSCDIGLSDVANEPIENEKKRQEVSSTLQLLTSNPGDLDTDDVILALDALENVIKTAYFITEYTATASISTISNVMESAALAKSGQAKRMLELLDRVAVLVDMNNTAVFKAVSKNVSVLATSSHLTGGSAGIVVVVRPNTNTLGFREDQIKFMNSSVSAGTVVNGEWIQGHIHVPKLASENAPRVYFKVFGNSNLFGENKFGISSPTENINIAMPVLSATVENRTITNLPSDERLIYSLLVPHDNRTQHPECIFWVKSANSWSNEGCNVVEESLEALTCSCDHLTNFAALLRPINEKLLSQLTIVGCSISTCSLLLLVMIFVCFPNTRSGETFQCSFLLLNLSLTLLGLNVTLLISEMSFINDQWNYDDLYSPCIVIAAVLHFFLLASCAWMNCMGAMLVLAILKPIWTRTRLSDRMVILASISWGWTMPAIFVGAVAIVDYSVYEYPHEENEIVTCWIHPSYIFCLAVVPTTIMIASNLVAYVILSYQLCRKRQSSRSGFMRSTTQRQKRKLLLNISFVTLLGITWIFGFFLVDIPDETTALIFAYIFIIFNSLQGFFLLILYVLRNPEVRLTLRKRLTTICDTVCIKSGYVDSKIERPQVAAVAHGDCIGDAPSGASIIRRPED